MDERPHLIVIGNGMAASRAVDELLARAPQAHRITVLEGASFEVARGEVVALIGHSGCGKSTLLNVIAGLHGASRGGVILEGHEVGPDRAMVFQTHALLPWLSAYDNVRLAVDRVFGKTKTKAERHDWTVQHLELAHAADRKPAEISGGMRQRVGIARALAMQPKVLLMDDPFGALDALTRAQLQDALLELHASLGMTVILVTHDVDEAVLLSDKVVMLTNGPHAHVGEVMSVTLARPRERLALAEDAAFTHSHSDFKHPPTAAAGLAPPPGSAA